MRRISLTILMTVFTAFLAVEAHGQVLSRLSAQYLRFDVTEGSCVAGAPDCPTPISTAPFGGKLIYSHAVFVPIAEVLYVSFAAQADTHGGAAEYIHCNIDGKLPCNAGTGGAGGAPTTWVNVMHHFDYQDAGVEQTYCSSAQGLFSGCGISGGDGGGGAGDEHDNAVYAHWCVAVPGGTHTVNLRLATGPVITGASPIAFFEAAHIFIDANKPIAGNACTKAPNM